MAYVNLAEVKRIMDIQVDKDDDLIARLIPWATDVIDRLTGRSFLEVAESAKILTGSGDSLFSIPDLVSLTSVELRIYPGDSFEIVPNDRILLEPSDKSSGEPYTGAFLIPNDGWSFWPACVQGVRITAVWGWSEVPAQIKEMAAYLIANWIRMGRLGFTSMLGNEETGFKKVSYNFPKLVKDTAEFYRRREIVGI